MSSDDVSRIEMLLREHFARTEKQLSDMRADNAEFRVQMMKEQREFEARQEARFSEFEARQSAFKARTDAKFEKLTGAIVELQRDVTGLKHDVQGLYHWDYWLLSIILVIFAMPQIVAGVKSLFGAIIDGVSALVALFHKDDNKA